MKNRIKAMAWVALSLIIIMAAWEFGKTAAPRACAKALFWCCVVGMIALWAFSLAAFIRMNKEKRPDVAAERDESLRQKQIIEQDPAAEQAHIAKLERRIWLRWGTIIGLHLLASFFAGMSGEGGVVWVFSTALMTVGILTLAPILAYGLQNAELELPDPDAEIDAEEFPELFALVREEAKRCGHDRELKLYIGSSGIGAFRGKTFDGLLLPPLAVGMLTKKELRQVLRHEFAHLVSKELELERRWMMLTKRRENIADTLEILALGMLVLMPVLKAFEERFECYRQMIQNKLENEADMRDLSPDEARDAVSAIAKSGMFAFFTEEDRVSTYQCYETEQPCPHQATIRSQVLKQMLEQRGQIWLSELENALPAPFASHPTFRQRREAYGVTEYDAFSKETDAAWLREMDRLLERENAYLAQWIGYVPMRERMYLNRRACIEAYEKCEDPFEKLKIKQILDVAEAYFGLETQKAVGIVREVLKKDPDNPDAMQLLGIMLLDERDDEGIELLYRIAEYNGYTMPALMAVGKYVFNRGNAALIEEYNRRSMEIIQKMEDFHYRLDEIRLKDLRPCTMSDNLLNALLSEMVRVADGGIAMIACAATDYDQSEDAHVFVLKYTNADDEERNEEIFMAVFDFLNRRPENYALRDDGELSIEKLEKQVPGCIVYQKENDR